MSLAQRIASGTACGIIAAVVLLAGCQPADTGAGIEGTGIRTTSPAAVDGIRTITGLINSVGADRALQVGTARITTAGAAIYVDGAPGAPDAIKANLVATIVGNLDPVTLSGPAQSVNLHSASTNGEVPALRLGLSYGQISAGHWLMFDGPEFSLDANATVLIDGEPASITGLTIGRGEVLLLNGVQSFDAEHNPGGLLAADRLEITHLVDGPTDSVDATHSRLRVLGQTVTVNGATCVAPGCAVGSPTFYNLADLASYQPGARVTVSGFLSATGEIVATRLAPSAVAGDFLVTGFVQSIDKSNHQFSVGGTLVNYASAALYNFSSGSPENGDRLIVRGTLPSGDVLAATDLTYLPAPLPGEAGSIATLHALVTGASSPSSLSVDGHPVQLTLAASQALATCPSALAPNRDVILSGQLAAGGTLLADFSCPEVTSAAAGTRESVSGLIDSIDLQLGALTILGFAIQTSITTEFVGVPDLVSLKIGDYVNADVNRAPVAGSWNASRIEFTTAGSSRVNAYDFDVALADPLIYISGHPMMTNGSTVFLYINRSDGAPIPLDRATFFAGPYSWPSFHWTCGQTLKVIVAVQSDGSLLVLQALVELDWDAC